LKYDVAYVKWDEVRLLYIYVWHEMKYGLVGLLGIDMKLWCLR